MIYGAPFDRGRQVNRWLRRGESGLIRGRSERVAPVKLRRSRGEVPGSAPGPDGGDGLPGAQGMSIGWKGYEQVGYRFALSLGLGAGTQYSPANVSVATTDIDGLPVNTKTSGAGANSVIGYTGQNVNSSAVEANLFQVGLGNGRGGFISYTSFAVSQLSATRRWFVGVAGGAGASSITWTGEPSSQINLIGVGQDSGDTSPQFMHNDGSGSATKVSTGLGTIVADRVYEVDIFCSPFTTDAEITLIEYTGTVVSATATATVSTNLPSILMSPVLYANNGSAGGATKLVLITYWCEVQPRASEL